MSIATAIGTLALQLATWTGLDIVVQIATKAIIDTTLGVPLAFCASMALLASCVVLAIEEETTNQKIITYSVTTYPKKALEEEARKEKALEEEDHKENIGNTYNYTYNYYNKPTEANLVDSHDHHEVNLGGKVTPQ